MQIRLPKWHCAKKKKKKKLEYISLCLQLFLWSIIYSQHNFQKKKTNVNIPVKLANYDKHIDGWIKKNSRK